MALFQDWSVAMFTEALSEMYLNPPADGMDATCACKLFVVGSEVRRKECLGTLRGEVRAIQSKQVVSLVGSAAHKALKKGFRGAGSIPADDFRLQAHTTTPNFIFEYCVGRLGKRLAVLYRIAIDDSADRERKKVIISGCLIGDSEAWRIVSRRWKACLADYGIAYFRSSECAALRGEFFRLNSLAKYPKPTGREAANKIRDELDGIIKDSSLVGIGSIMPVSVFEKLIANPRYSPIIGKDPYDLAVQTLWDECTKAMKELGKNNLATFAHDDGTITTIFELCLETTKKKNPKSAKKLVDFIPLDDKAHPSIQAADVAASVTQNLAIQWVDSPSNATLQRLKGRMYKAVVWTEQWSIGLMEAILAYQAKVAK